MYKADKRLPLLLFYLVSLICMEIILRLNIQGDPTLISSGLLISLIFTIVTALIIYVLTSLFQKRVNHILSVTLLTLTGMIFSTQFLYHQFFRTFYSFYSAGNVSQILEFRQDIVTVLNDNHYVVFLFFLPALILLLVGRRLFNFGRISFIYRGLLICSVIIFHITGLTIIWFNGQDQNSAYDLYFNTRDHLLSADRLGMITTMRLDFQRTLTGWSPTQYVPDMPVLDSKTPEPPVHVEENDNEVAAFEEAIQEDTQDADTEQIEIEYNISDIDFDEMILDEHDETIRQMHAYFKNVEPTAKNDYTGLFEGYNVIFITAESYAPYAVHEEITPTLFKLVHEGFDFTNFYVPLWDVSSSDGEYVSLTSLVPKSGVWSFSASSNIELPFVMGNLLKEYNYNTVAYHNHTYSYYNRDASHPNMGYDYTGIGNGLEISGGWPRSDLEMMQATVPEYIDDEPFHAYYVTVSGHMQYSFAGNNIAYKNRELVQNLSYSEQAKAYLATQIELDKALENMLDQLEDAGIADRTLIVLATDHYPYGLEKETIDELAGHTVDGAFELYKSSLLLYSKDMEPMTIDKPSSNMDITPTLYNLLGVEYDSRLFMGSDIFSDSSPLIMFRNKSFITDKGKYNSATGEFTPNAEHSHENFDSYIEDISLIVENKFYYSVRVLETDYFSKVK